MVPHEQGGLAKSPNFQLQTERVRLRLAEPRDWRAVDVIYSDERNYEDEISKPASVSDTKKDLKVSGFPRGFAKSRRLVFLAIDDAGEVVGVISVNFGGQYDTASLGFMLAFGQQGKGYGTEAVGAVCQWLIKELNVEKIQAMCDSENKSCRSLLKRVGFHSEGTLKKFFHHPGRGWLDSPIYAMFRED